jgi:hypothetical protein
MDICTVIFCSRLLYDLAMMNDFHDIDERGTLEVKDQRAGCYQARRVVIRPRRVVHHSPGGLISAKVSSVR